MKKQPRDPRVEVEVDGGYIRVKVEGGVTEADLTVIKGFVQYLRAGGAHDDDRTAG